MIQILQQLAHLNTVRESLDIISNAISSLKDGVTNIDLSSVISKIEENTAELSSKIEGVQIDTTDLAKELTLAEVSNKLDNLNVDIDLSQVAKLGENTEATLTAIYQLLIGSNKPSPDIPEGVAERLALILEFFGMKPIETYGFMTAEEVCADLEDIMTTMDIDLTPEKAKEITQQTLNN